MIKNLTCEERYQRKKISKIQKKKSSYFTTFKFFLSFVFLFSSSLTLFFLIRQLALYSFICLFSLLFFCSIAEPPSKRNENPFITCGWRVEWSFFRLGVSSSAVLRESLHLFTDWSQHHVEVWPWCEVKPCVWQP